MGFIKCCFASGGVRTHAAFAKGSPSQSVGPKVLPATGFLSPSP